MKRILVFFILLGFILHVDYQNIQLESQERKSIEVRIDGEVEKPGVYILPNHATLNDLILKCGLKDDADIDTLNLSNQLHQDDQIKIYKKDDTVEKVSINASNLDQLITLPGIREKIAQRIIDYRNENGFFQNLEDIKNVKGIGDKKYEKILPFIKL